MCANEATGAAYPLAPHRRCIPTNPQSNFFFHSLQLIRRNILVTDTISKSNYFYDLLVPLVSYPIAILKVIRLFCNIDVKAKLNDDRYYNITWKCRYLYNIHDFLFDNVLLLHVCETT